MCTLNKFRISITSLLFFIGCCELLAAGGHRGAGCWRGKAPRKAAMAHVMSTTAGSRPLQSPYSGQKKGLVILAQFPDIQFKSGHDKDKYTAILNEPDYTTEEGFIGSVADYFHAQSNGQFELTFDVVGPYTTAHKSSYYGENDEDGYDLHPEEMIIEMCEKADEEVDFSDYDWDGDGEVDEVFVVYAGKSESENTSKPTLIWPHMWTLDEADKDLVLDSIRINVYACSNEIRSNGGICGIGTFCHEFSHCLGLPDFYDVYYNGSEEMGDFDLMSGGSYNGDGFCPPSYTAYEKMVCGWQAPIVLGLENVSVKQLAPISENGDIYIIYNDGHPDEYYMIENRQKTGWDTSYPTAGLMITHVDYDEEVWYNNIPNAVVSEREAKKQGLTCGNDHSRMTFFNAYNSKWKSKLYPYNRKDSLTATSKPAATLYNENAMGTKIMQGAILGITQNSDGTMDFNYRAETPVVDAIRTVTPTPSQHRIYTLDGRTINEKDATSLGHGIYIIDGRKRVR